MLLAALALAAPGLAAAGPARTDDVVLRPSAGGFDAIRAHDPAAEFGIQVRPGVSLGVFHLMLGAMVTTDAAVNAYAGLCADIPLGGFAITPSFAPGAFHRGRGKDLGSAVEFRSAIELSYKLGTGRRLGVEIYHLSNASIGARNPGEESIVVTYHATLRSAGR